MSLTSAANTASAVFVFTAKTKTKTKTHGGTPLSPPERKPAWCRAFPRCRYGDGCAFRHPRCKFAEACLRRGCAYAHTRSPAPPAAAKPADLSQSQWCLAFPKCRYGAACAFRHPRCKFAPACTRPRCVYSHSPASPVAPTPAISSHVVPAAKGALPRICKYHPSCNNTACSSFHPKACRYGTACPNKLDCKFYHADLSAFKWRCPA